MSYVGSFQAAQRELERQRKEEWERRRRGELQIKREQEQDDIIRLKAKKRSLEMELEAVVSSEEETSYSICLSLSCCLSPIMHVLRRVCKVSVCLSQGNKHRQISDRLRDFHNKKKLHKTELDLTNQRIETRQQDINNLQKQLEVCVCSVCLIWSCVFLTLFYCGKAVLCYL